MNLVSQNKSNFDKKTIGNDDKSRDKLQHPNKMTTSQQEAKISRLQ